MRHSLARPPIRTSTIRWLICFLIGFPCLAIAEDSSPPKADGTTSPTTRPTTRFVGSRIAARQPHQPRGLQGVGLTDREVATAIDRGADSLWKQIQIELKSGPGKKFGDRGGYDLLYALALVKAGAHHRIPEFDVQLRACLASVKPEQLGTYPCSVLCMLIDVYGDPAFLPKLRLAARYLLEGQGSRGSWDYIPKVAEHALQDPNSMKAVQVWGGIPFEGTDRERWRRVTVAGEDHNGDNSLTQYAILGLHAASRNGVEVPVETWKRVYDLYRTRQAEDGAWSYVEPTALGSGAMTCAGIYAVALSKYHTGDKDAAQDESIERALGWLAKNFTATDNPNAKGYWVYYYLYSLERAARTLGTEFIGEYEWYPLGAKFLLSQQQQDGSWPRPFMEGPPEAATSFAILFLSRGTVTMGEARPRGGRGTLKTALIEPPSPRVYLILDCSGSMLEEMGPKTKFDAARDAVTAIVQDLPAKTQIALRAYGHRKRSVEPGANEDTELLVPMAEVRPDALAAVLGRLRARGLTPMARSLREAAKDLANVGSGEIAVILLTDGGEDTFPRQDPVAATTELAKAKNITLQIVGFDIGREDWGQQLKAMATAGRGRYWPATDPGDLRREMKAAVLRTPGVFTITDTAGHAVANGTFGQSLPLPEGSYHFATSFGGKAFKEPFWINTESTTAVLFDADKIDFTPPSGAAPMKATTQPSTIPFATGGPGISTAPSTHPAAAKMRFCAHCGKPLQPAVKFCTECGAKVE